MRDLSVYIYIYMRELECHSHARVRVYSFERVSGAVLFCKQREYILSFTPRVSASVCVLDSDCVEP